MVPILVSACLLGDPVRYDASAKRCAHPLLMRWVGEGRVVGICPELAGGLGVPRAPNEIEGGAGGLAVLAGQARVLDRAGRDCSAPFVRGAEAALALAHERGIRLALLKQASPSCGSRLIYDGSFQGRRLAGQGVTAARLAAAGILVFGEDEIEAAAQALSRLDASNAAGTAPRA